MLNFKRLALALLVAASLLSAVGCRHCNRFRDSNTDCRD